MTRCSYCGFEFEAAAARTACAGCFKSGGCRGVRCPRCGYDMPEEIGLIRWIRTWRERRGDGDGRKNG